MSNDEIGKFLKSRLNILLENPNIRVGKISFFDKIKFNIIFRGNLTDRRLKQLFLSGTKIPLWEKNILVVLLIKNLA